MQGDAKARQRRIGQQLAGIGLDPAAHAHGNLPAGAVAQAPDILPALAAHQHQAIVPRQVLRRVRRAAPAQVIRRGAQHAPVDGETACHQRGIVERPDADGQVEAGADEVEHVVVQVHADR
ncbi:hypothetical protein D3C72_2172500 [compost metagenome]